MPQLNNIRNVYQNSCTISRNGSISNVKSLDVLPKINMESKRSKEHLLTRETSSLKADPIPKRKPKNARILGYRGSTSTSLQKVPSVAALDVSKRLIIEDPNNPEQLITILNEQEKPAFTDVSPPKLADPLRSSMSPMVKRQNLMIGKLLH